MSSKKSYAEINEKIRAGKAVVLTAEEVVKLSAELSAEEIAERVDVVTTATFGPMCSSGAFINFGHSKPGIRMEEITLNGVPVYGGIAAVDAYIGATGEHPENKNYGGAHLIEELIQGKDLLLLAKGKGTDCYPRRQVTAIINRSNVNEMTMFNPRNAYQNYPAAINSSKETKYTYMGTLLPEFGNINYSTSGELSPLLKDPDLRTIGIGTRIFLAGAQGYVAFQGTQFCTGKAKNEHGIPVGNSATLALVGDMKKMNPKYIKAAVYEKYGVSLFVGIGVPIPILDADIARAVSKSCSEIETTICDYGKSDRPELCRVTYGQLMSGSVEINGKKIKTAPLSSLYTAREIAAELKKEIACGNFLISEPVELFAPNNSLKSLNILGD